MFKLFKVLVLFLFLFSFNANATNIKETTYTVMIPKNWQPYYKIDNKGKPTGFAIELFEEIAKNLDLKYSYKSENSWDDVFLSLEKEPAYIVPDIGISKKRAEIFVYSDFTNTFEIKLFKRKNSKINSIEDLKNKKVGVLQRNIGMRIMKNHPDIKSVVFKTQAEAIRELLSGNIDAICYPELSMNFQLKNMSLDKKIHSFGNTLHEVKRGVGVSKQHKDLIPFINQELISIKQSGKYDELYNKWFIKKQANKLNLTKEEKEYLKNNPILKVQGLSTFAPFNFYENGKTIGYTIDYLNLMKKELDVKLAFIENKSFPKTISMFKDGKIDILPHIAVNKTRDEFITFTNFNHINYSIGATLSVDLNITNFEQLKNKTVAVIDKTFISTFIKKKYPNQKVLSVKSTNDGVLAVSNEKADAFIGSIPTMDFYIKKNWLNNVKTKQIEGIGLPSEVSLPMGVQKGNTLLKSILEKANANIDYSEQLKLKEKWLGISSENSNLLNLTIDEKRYLDTKKNFNICVLPNWLPFEQIDKEKNHKGIGQDILNIISEKINKKFILIPTEQWSQSLQNIRDRKCDILPVAMDIPSRRDAMNFTKPYVAEPFVIATTSDKFFIKDEKGLSNKKIGVVKSYAFIEVLKQKNPLIEIVEVKDTKEGLERVENGELFGYIDTMPTIGYFIQKHGYFNLKIAGKLPYDITLSIASRNDEPLLNSVLQKTLNTISEEEIRKIVGKWIEIKVQEEFDYTKLFYVIGFFVLIILLGAYRNKKTTEQKNELKELNKKILQQKEELESAQEIAKVGNYLYKIKEDIFICSKQVDNVFGLDENDEKTFESWISFVHTEDKEMVSNSFNSILETKQKFDSEYRIINKKTLETKWVHGLGEFSYDKDGNAYALYGTIQDITERKNNEANLKQALYIFENTYDGIMITDENANIINVNKSFERVTGYSLNDVKGLKPSILKSGFHDSNFYEEMWNSLKNDGFWTGEITNYTKNGNLYEELLTITAVYDEKNNLSNFVGIFTDITKQKQQDNLLQKQARTSAIGEMIGNIAHQWRQPLSVISTASTGMKLQMEMDSISKEDSLETLSKINSQAQYLSKTIEDFRGFFTENLSEVTEFKIDETIEKVENLTRDSLNNNFVEIKHDLGENIYIKGNKNLLIQAFINIYNNALDVLKTKDPTEKRLLFIQVSKKEINLNNSDSTKKRVIISIKDNGGGIENNVIEKIFDPYFTTKHQSQGTGIGLYMTHQIITKQFKGSIDVSSVSYTYEDKKYKGAEFIITI